MSRSAVRIERLRASSSAKLAQPTKSLGIRERLSPMGALAANSRVRRRMREESQDAVSWRLACNPNIMSTWKSADHCAVRRTITTSARS